MAKTVLIVDDNTQIRQALCELFQGESDFEVCGEAGDGKEAIAKALELKPDLIVLDLSMPVMNGLDAARELKRLMPTVPLILCSLFGDRFVEQQARLIGISELVSKSQPAAILVSKARGLVYHSAAWFLLFPIWETLGSPSPEREGLSEHLQWLGVLLDGQGFAISSEAGLKSRSLRLQPALGASCGQALTARLGTHSANGGKGYEKTVNHRFP
jgi:CheY-like chemotaxis protein